MQRWIDQAPPERPALRGARDAFRRSVQYVPYRKWKAELQKSLALFVAHIGSRPYYLVLPFGHNFRSGFWASEIAIRMLSDMHAPLSVAVVKLWDLPALPQGPEILLVDDAIYSGQQVSSKVDTMCTTYSQAWYKEAGRQAALEGRQLDWRVHEKYPMLQVNVVAPYARADGAAYVEGINSGCATRVFHTQTTPTFGELLDEDALRQISHEYHVSRDLSSTYFQFKMPDSRSIPEKVMAEGHFVRGCDGRMGCPDGQYFRHCAGSAAR